MSPVKISPEVPSCDQSWIITYAAIHALREAAQLERCTEEALVADSIAHVRQCAICQAYLLLIINDPTATKRDIRLDSALTAASPAESVTR
jgi:hypothetical protein